MGLTHSQICAIQYNRLLHDSKTHGTYRPNAGWDQYTSNLLELVQAELPNNSGLMSVTDLGSGAGKWSALLSPNWNQIFSMEPDPTLGRLQTELMHSLRLKNVKISRSSMPDCINDVKSDAAMMFESLYLTVNWEQTFKNLLSVAELEWIIIADGPDDENTEFDSMFSSPHVRSESRLPMDNDSVWKMKQIATTRGYNVKLFDIWTKLPLSYGMTTNRWAMFISKEER